MNLIDQFAAGAFFDMKSVVKFKEQSLWKSVFYVLVFVLVTGGIRTFFTWENSVAALIEYAGGDPEMLQLSHFFAQYLLIALDLITHFAFISLIAFSGVSSFKRIARINYKEAWTMTAYGISSPILVRLIIQIIDLTFPLVFVFYWGAIALFSLLCLKHVASQEH